MAATSQCVGPSLDAGDDGVLDVRLAGNPADQYMPATGSSLRLDPGRGVWAPAETRTLQIYGSRHDSHGGVIVNPGGQRRGNVLALNVTNPSPVRSMLALVVFDVKLVHAIAKNVTTGWVLEFGYDVDADPGATVALTSVIARRDQGITTGEAGFVHTHAEATHLIIAPGAVAKIRFQVAASCIDTGYVKVTDTWQGIRGLGVTL